MFAGKVSAAFREQGKSKQKKTVPKALQQVSSYLLLHTLPL